MLSKGVRSSIAFFKKKKKLFILFNHKIMMQFQMWRAGECSNLKNLWVLTQHTNYTKCWFCPFLIHNRIKNRQFNSMIDSLVNDFFFLNYLTAVKWEGKWNNFSVSHVLCSMYNPFSLAGLHEISCFKCIIFWLWC